MGHGGRLRFLLAIGLVGAWLINHVSGMSPLRTVMVLLDIHAKGYRPLLSSLLGTGTLPEKKKSPYAFVSMISWNHAMADEEVLSVRVLMATLKKSKYPFLLLTSPG